MPPSLLVQPHALILVVNRSGYRIKSVSDNSERICGRPADRLLASPLAALIGEDSVTEIGEYLQVEHPAVVALPAVRDWEEKRYQAVIFPAGPDSLVLEIEPRQSWPRSGDYSARLNDLTRGLEDTGSTEELLQQLCEELLFHFQFDRAVVINYDSKGDAIVNHESRREGIPSLLQVHLVEADIPPAVRRQQEKEMLLHYIAGDTAAVGMQGEPGSEAEEVLRHRISARQAGINSIDFLHATTLSTLTILSLIVEGKLWGSVYLHSDEPLLLDYQMRAFLRIACRVAQQKIAYHLSHQSLYLRESINTVRDDLYGQILQAETLPSGLTEGPVTVLDLLEGTEGAAICSDDELSLFGQTPSHDEVNEIIAWLKECIGEENVYHTDRLSHTVPHAIEYAERAAGMLYLPLDPVANHWIAWFKPERQRMIRFGSRKSGAASDEERVYEINEQLVHDTSLPWTSHQIALAEELRSFLQKTVFRRHATSRRLNTELREAIKDLEVFSYTVGHDLRAPLRGIASFAEILEEDFAAQLGEEGQGHLDVIRRNADRMRIFMDDLLTLSRIDRSRMQARSLSVHTLVKRVLSDLDNRYDRLPELKVQDSLPDIVGDRNSLITVFTNLLSNAFKYSAKADRPRVEVGWTGEYRQEAPVFFVSDNGIGVPADQQQKIFDLFTRSSNSDGFSGTGIGLALVKRIIRFHDGEIWLESEPGAGSRFLFYTGINTGD